MGLFILRRFGVMVLTAICLTYIVFFMTNLYPNLEKLAKTQGNFRMSDEAVASFLEDRGYLQSTPRKYLEWVGLAPGYLVVKDDGIPLGKCVRPGMDADEVPQYCGILQGDWGWSTVSKAPVSDVLGARLANTGYLMWWVMVLMVPMASGTMTCPCFRATTSPTMQARGLSTPHPAMGRTTITWACNTTCR